MRYILILPILIMLLIFTACDKNGSVPENMSPQVLIAADGATDYILIRPDDSSDELTKSVSVLRGAIEKASGAEIKIDTDWTGRDGELTGNISEYEILIGGTNRRESVSVNSGLGEYDSAVRLVGKKVVITGGSETAQIAAVEYFINTYLSGVNSLAIPVSLDYKFTPLVSLSPSDGETVSINPTFTWTDTGNDGIYTLYIQKADGSAYTTTAEYSVKGSSFTLTDGLDYCTNYRWLLADSSNNIIEGEKFMTEYIYTAHPANIGRDYTFSGPITEKVLRNYLSRAINHFYFEDLSADAIAQNKRFVLSTGAKFIGRASTMWGMGGSDEAVIDQYAAALADIHESDPEIIFEACIFETTFTSIEQIAIPAWVFEASGAEPETRSFSYNAMLFPNKKFVDQWGKGASVPDMTQPETQMWFYYRAVLFIDAGFECLHMGQVHLIGADDTGFKCWTKVMNMIRDYASKNARRNFVLINAHTHGIIGTDGLLLFDFHRYPIRGVVPDSETDHKPAEKTPQKILLMSGHADALFGNSLGGKTHSGWSSDMLPYMVELDNYCGYIPGSLDKAGESWWGYDEISWFANQPYWYQRYWLDYAYSWVIKVDNGQGSFEMPGSRTAAIRSGDDLKMIQQLYFYPYDKAYSGKGTNVEQIIREVWVKDNQGN